MHILMLVTSDVVHDARVLREAATLADAGHRVLIIGRGVPAGWQPEHASSERASPEHASSEKGTPGELRVLNVGAAGAFARAGVPTGAARPPRLNPMLRAARWVLLPTHRQSTWRAFATDAVALALTEAARDPFDAVHAHDLTTLDAASRLAHEWGVPYVYDSHELWSGLPQVGRPTPLLARREAAMERRLGAGAAAVITVGAGVAAELARRYGWTHVHVVRNTFPEPEPGELAAWPPLPAAPQGLVYAGRLAGERELEVLAAASWQVTLPVRAVGPADAAWLAAFDPGRIEVLAALPPDAVEAVLRSAGLALVSHSDKYLNHLLALPNKLFHAVRAGVPVIATDVPELASVVRAHDLGELYTPGDATSLAAAVARAIARYPGLCASVAAASATLSWPVDAEELLAVYRDVATFTLRYGPAARDGG